MKGKPCWLSVACMLTCIASACLLPGVGAERPAFLRYTGTLVSGGYAWDFERAWDVAAVAERGPFTGFAFGPGRTELAYCAPADQGISGLWVVSVPLSEDRLEMPESGRLTRRLLWTAPEGVILRGPIWWAPNGSAIAIRACRGEDSDLVVVDYVSGEPTWVTQGKRVTDATSNLAADQLSYVMEEDSGQSVWLMDIASGETRRLGEGGVNLRWSVDGRELSWLTPQPGDFWPETIWRAGDEQPKPGERRPARPAGAMWSPDNLWCAAAVGESAQRQLLLWRSASPAAETIKLPGAPVKQLLGWSPDSSMLLVLSADNRSLAISIEQLPDDVARLLSTEGALFSTERAAIAGWPMDVAAGSPSWSSTGTMMLAYVAGTYPDPVEVAQYGLMNADFAGSLVVGVVPREYLGPREQLAYNIERKQLVSNMKHVVLALQMYTADWDCYPLAQNTQQLMDPRWGVCDYILSNSCYMRPGLKGEVAVKYLVPPGTPVSAFWKNGVDPKEVPVAIVDYHPDYFVVAFADGHCEVLQKDRWVFDGQTLQLR